MRSARAPQVAALLGSFGGRTANSRAARSRIPNSPRRLILRAVSRLLAVWLLAVGCSAAGPVERREAQGLGTAHEVRVQHLTRRGRANGESAANAVRSAPRPQDRASQGTPTGGRGAEVGLCSLPTFLHKQESRSPAGVTSRRGLTQCDQPLNRAHAGLDLHQAIRSHWLDAKGEPNDYVNGPPS